MLSYILLSCGKPKESNRNMVKLSFDKMCLLSDEIYSDSILAVILYYDSLSCTSCVFKKNYLKNIKTFRFVLFGSILYHELKN